jgi:hypothetical protein
MAGISHNPSPAISYLIIEKSPELLDELVSIHWGVIRQFFKNHTIPACIFSFPELADSFRRLIQPLTISQ